jgi:hypothetical protein
VRLASTTWTSRCAGIEASICWCMTASSCALIATSSGSSRGQTVARYACSYLAGTWQPAPRMRPEPPSVAPAIPLAIPVIVPPARADYAELCA